MHTKSFPSVFTARFLTKLNAYDTMAGKILPIRFLEDRMKKVLIVAYMFPPISGGGTQRPLKFTKYLPQFGIQPIVFCPRHARWKAEDPTLLNQPFLKSTVIYRCGIRRLARYYRLRYDQERRRHMYYFLLAARYIWHLDFFSAWFFECRRHVLEIVRKEDIDFVFTTSPPHSIHLFGLWIKHQCGIPWVMDIRDAMFDDPNRKSSFFKNLQKIIEYRYEKKFYRLADAITTVSEPIRGSIIRRHANLSGDSKIKVITNGFDEDDFASIDTDPVGNCKLTVTYTGSFMGKQTPDYFLKALQQLIEKEQIDPAKLKLQFVGHYDSPTLELFKRFQNKIPIEVIDFLPYRESLNMLIRSTLLLLIVNITEVEGGAQTMTGKFFDYVGAKRPIFGLVPEGPLKNIIQNGGFGFVAPPRDIDAIEKVFLRLYSQWIQNGKIAYSVRHGMRSRFDRRNLTRELAETAIQCLSMNSSR
jgi:glycosyltransferase involved in cell wall biosynthesis